MKYSIFSIAALLLFCISANAQKTQLDNFEELMAALNSGEDVRAFIDYGKCGLVVEGDTVESVNAIGGMQFGTWEYFAKMSIRNEKAYVTASESVLIGHPFYGYVYNYAKLRVYENSDVQVIAQYLDPNTFEVKMDEMFITKINDGKNKGALFLFK